MAVNPAVASSVRPMNRLERFRTLRARLDPTGDAASAMGDFYVEVGRSVSSRIVAEIELAPSSSHLIVGGVGSGKTTELKAVEHGLWATEDIATLYVDVSKQHDIAKMIPGAVLAQVGLALAEHVEIAEPKNPRIAQARDIAHGAWEDPNWHSYQGEGDGVYVPGILIPPDVVSENIQRALQPFDGLLASIRTSAPHVVVMLDGLDRMTDLKAFEQLVTHDVRALTTLGIGVVLVGPLRALYGIDRMIVQRFDSFHYQPWIDVTQNEAGRHFLAGVLTRRAVDAFDPPGIEALVAASGGVLRDLLSLAQSALVEAYMGGNDRVGSHEVDDAVEAFGRKHLQGLRAGELEVLQRVRVFGSFVQTSEDDLALLMTRRVLEYRSQGQPRYAVHPTIEHLLRELTKQ